MSNFTESTDYIGKEVEMIVERPLGSVHPKHAHIIYQVNYGYIPHTLSSDGEELDAYLLGITEPLKTFKGICIAVLRRTEESDDKLIIAPKGKDFSEGEIRALVEFQEKFFQSEIIKSPE
ncbi:MAG TPA: inorganic diphosphatase [Alphaproteobacteria bacterium]|nr:inorganic diphosphatase [Alphaproteobacteria bacterium]